MLFFRIACILLLFTSASHLAGHFFLIPQLHVANNFSAVFPANETERSLMKMMIEYEKNVGGAKVSMMDIQNGLSLCYGVFFLWTGILNLIISKGLVRNKRMLVQICFLNIAVMLVGAWISHLYFFWVPLASFSLTAIFFGLAAFRFRRDF
jgi:hypothetical protein